MATHGKLTQGVTAPVFLRSVIFLDNAHLSNKVFVIANKAAKAVAIFVVFLSLLQRLLGTSGQTG